MTTPENRSDSSENCLRRRYRRRLASAQNIKSALRDLYGQLEANVIDVRRARAMAHVLHVLVGVVVASDIEVRLTRLEAAAAARDVARLGAFQ
jgi:hypothetical protein